MATQQLMFDILATAKGVDKTFQEVVDSADSMAGKLGAVGAKATQKLFSPTTAALAGGVAGAALMQGIGTAIDMDSTVSQMTAGLGLAAPESEKAGKVAGELYKSGYSDSFEGVTEAVSATLSSIRGMSQASEGDIQAMTAKVMDLSKAFDLDVGRTAQIAGQMIKSGLAKDGAEAADLLAGSLQKVPVNLREDLLDVVDEYGPFMDSLGIKGADAMGMLVAASDKGMFGIDKTGDALKEFTIRATDMSTASGAAYKALGMNQEEMTKKILAGGPAAKDAFAQIVGGLSSMTDPAAQSQAALALFGTPLEDLGTAQIPAFLNQIDPMGDAFDTMEGSAGKLGETINSGPGAAFTTFQRTAETTLGAIGAQVLPILTPILQGLSEFAPVIGPAVIALGALAAVIAVVNFVMALNPITWIIVGIVALIAAIVLLVMNWDAVVAFLTQVWGGFVNWIGEVIGGFVNWWNGVWAGFVGWTNDLWSNFVTGLTVIWNGFVGWIMGIVNGFVGFLAAAWSGAVNFAIGVWNGLGSFFSGLWSGIVNGVSSTIGNIGNFFADLPGKIMGFFAGAGTWLFNFGRDIVNGLGQGLQSMAGSIGNFFLNMLPDWIREPFKAALGIHSPSTEFAGYGQNIGEGVIVGLGRMQGRIDDRMASLVTVPDVAVSGAYGFTAGGGSRSGSTGQSLEEKFDALLDLLRTQRPVQVHAAPGMSEETLARAAAEQMLWKG